MEPTRATADVTARSRPDASPAPCWPPAPVCARPQQRRRPAARPLIAANGRRRHTRPEQHRHHLRQPPLRKELRMTRAYRLFRQVVGHTAPRPTHRMGTPPASSATPAATSHDRRCSVTSSGRGSGRVEYLTRYRSAHGRRRRQRRPAAPASTPEHAPQTGPGCCAYGTASCPCAPPVRPACDPSCPSG